MQYLNKQFPFFIISFLTLCSCSNLKNTVYFNQSNSDSDSTNFSTKYALTYQTNDMLSITISATDAETVRPFNLKTTEMGSSDSKDAVSKNQSGYLIDSDGNIEFPVIGKLKVANLNQDQTIQLIKSKLNPYIDHPFVNVQLLNFNITVLGEVRHPGTFKIQDEQVSLLEALGYAEDLNITAIRKNVLIIREENGVKKEIRVDLTNKKFLNSPNYYLKQNDVIYVQPNRSKSNSAIIGPSFNILVSLFSLAITSVLFILK